MQNIEAVLIFVGIPAVITAVITGAVYRGGSRRSRRYRPGRPFEFTPVWFLAAPERQLTAARTQAARAEVRRTPAAPAVTGANALALPPAEARTGTSADEGTGEWPPTDRARHEDTGGASDRW